MFQTNQTSARGIATEMLQAFIDGETNVDMITKGKDVARVKIAQTMAKSTAAMVIFHARAARKAKTYDVVPSKLRDMVITYQHNKNRRAKAA